MKIKTRTNALEFLLKPT